MSVNEKRVDFKRLEEEIFRKCMEIGREALGTVLMVLDEELARKRDTKRYRHKGKRGTTIKTLMGEVTFERTLYKTCNDEGVTIHVYLLDEYLGLGDGVGFMSAALSEAIANACCEGTYRQAAGVISELTGQQISHMAAWNVTQNIGRELGKIEERSAVLAAHGDGTGTLEAKLLFEAQDGIWLPLQGPSRKQYGDKHEMKLSIAYDGAEKVGKKRYRLTNKVACANFEDAEKFVKRKEGVIAGVYNVDEIQMRLLNGDGAPWIKHSLDGENGQDRKSV
ncbi:MAG: UPF0236 family protein, partial [Oscillospiraceae bacterium]|nr:UPF0236 family protein [Oscillospiraceae bacterium]